MLERGDLLPHRLARLAEARPDEVAVVEVGGPTLTWSELEAAARRWAGCYQALGIEAGDMVATMLSNSASCLSPWIGAGRVRAIEVPFNTMYRGAMLRYVLENSGAAVFVIASRFLEQLEPIAGDLTSLKTVVVPDAADADLPSLPFQVLGRQFIAEAGLAEDLDGPDPRDVALMIYTSGTTGPSKGVLMPWAQMHYLSNSSHDTTTPGENHYNTLPLFHMAGRGAFYSSVLYELRLVIREAFSVSGFWDDVRRYDISTCGIVGPMASMLMAAPPQPDDADNPLERVILSPVIRDIEEFMTRFGISKIRTGYGMTEIGMPIQSSWDAPNRRTCGRRREGAPGFEMRVVDEHDRPVPTGAVGELVVRASEPWAMNLGYWGYPEKTVEAWRNGWFHTGDAFVEDEDGWFYFTDRMKDALRRRGENISSAEVEAGVLEYPAVAECAVVGVPSDFGEDEVKAVIVLVPGAELEPRALIEFLEPTMPRFMIPRYVEIVPTLPKTDATFRVRKVELREQGVTATTWDREGGGLRGGPPDSLRSP